MTYDVMQMPQKKAGVIILAAAGVLVLAAGFWSISYKIRSPFFLRAVNQNLLGADAVPDMAKDTDGDGVTDWEEENIYHTSPYLADTDSDGISDSEEIKNGTDPNCAEGKVCGVSDALTPPPAAAIANPPAAVEAPGVAPSAAIPTNLTASQVRDLLKQAGMSDADLKKLDDKAIMEIYNEALKEANKGQ